MSVHVEALEDKTKTLVQNLKNERKKSCTEVGFLPILIPNHIFEILVVQILTICDFMIFCEIKNN